MINLNNPYVLERHIYSFLNKDKEGYSIQRDQKGVRKA
jgi:hypothetical protein